MKYTPSHEWIKASGNTFTVGITDFAKEELGEVVYVQLPSVGKKFSMGEEIAILESTKAAADIYAPVSGEVVAVNEGLPKDLSLLNQSPEEKGWLFRMTVTNPEELDYLLTHDAYLAMLES
jgi:glycine cleavage system H protein